MSSPRFITRVLCFTSAVFAGACAGQSPAAPGLSSGSVPMAVDAAAPNAGSAATILPGTYVLTFHNTAGAEVTTLPVLNELILKAHITDGLGQPAQGGTVTFEYCSRKGLPPNDITRADEAPTSECQAGTARWKSLLNLAVNQFGEAAMDFGFVQIPRTIGFRIRYQGGRRVGIADGVGGPRDIEITAQ